MADLTLAVELVGRDVSASTEIKKVADEARRLDQAASQAGAGGLLRFASATASARTEVQAFETVVARRLIPGLGIMGLSAGAVAGAGVLALGAALGVAVRQGIAMDATLEQETLRFKAFGLSAQDAQAHVQELFQLGAETPFTAQQLIESSRLLRTFGGAALDTRATLVTLGDTSAATGADLNALSFWVGRLYADLKAGKPIGEAEQNLRQLAVLTPEAAREMEKLAAKGAPVEQTFGAFTNSLRGFSGAMQEQSHTLAGLTSTLSDNLSQLAGVSFEGAFRANKDALESLNASLSSPETKQSARDAGAGFGLLVTTAAQAALAVVDLDQKWMQLWRDVSTHAVGTRQEGQQPAIDRALGAAAPPEGSVAAALFAAAAGRGQQRGAPITNLDIAEATVAERERLLGRQRAMADVAERVAAQRERGADIVWSDVATEQQQKAIQRGEKLVETIKNDNDMLERHANLWNFAAEGAGNYWKTLAQMRQDTADLGQRLAQQVGEGDLFTRHPAAQLAEAMTGNPELRRQAQLAQRAAQFALDAAAPGVRLQEDQFTRNEALAAQQRELGTLQAHIQREYAEGQAAAARGDEARLAALRDQDATEQRVQANLAAQADAEARIAGLRVQQQQAIAAGNDADAASLGAQIALWQGYAEQVKAAGDAIKETADAQQQQAAREAERRFAQSQEAAQGGIQNQALKNQVQEYRQAQQNLALQQQIDRERQQGQADRADRDAAHLKYLEALQANQRDLLAQQQALAEAEAQLKQAEHDGDQARIDALKAQIDLLKQMIAAVTEAGTKIKEQFVPVGQSGIGAGLLQNAPRTNLDPYRLYHPGGVYDPNRYGTGIGGYAPEHRQAGGPVWTGQPYLVGEAGPEVFVPRQSGAIKAGGLGHTFNAPLVQVSGVTINDQAELNAWGEHIVHSVLDALELLQTASAPMGGA